MRAFMDSIYEPFWKRELDVEDRGVLAKLLTEVGADGDGFADYAEGEGRRLHDELRAEAWEKGVFGVPTFRIDEEIFFGRDQLDFVRYRLTGGASALPQ